MMINRYNRDSRKFRDGIEIFFKYDKKVFIINVLRFVR